MVAFVKSLGVNCQMMIRMLELLGAVASSLAMERKEEEETPAALTARVFTNLNPQCQDFFAWPMPG